MQGEKKRVDYVDIYRAIGIISMIMGHIGFGSYFDKFIHAFHMPMFFFVTGWFYSSKRTISTFALSRARTLIIPYIVCGSVLLLQTALNKGPFTQTFSHLIWNNTEGLLDFGGLWFLTAMFFASVVYKVVDMAIGEKHILHNICIFGLALVGSLGEYIPIQLPWALYPALVGIGLIHIGRLIGLNKNRFNKLLNCQNWLFIVMVAVWVALIFVNGNIKMRTSIYSNIPLFWFNATLSFIVLWNCSKVFEKILDCCKVGGFIKIILTSIGKDSIVYLCFNQIIIHFLKINICVESTLLKHIMILGLTVIILYSMAYVVNITKMRYIFGK